MRKGILSLSLPGRGKAAGKKKPTNMELAEQAAAKKTAAAEVKTETNEKAFVQTIMVPKQNTILKKVKHKTGAKSRK